MLINWLEPFFELSPPGQSTAHAPRPLLTPPRGTMPTIGQNSLQNYTLADRIFLPPSTLSFSEIDK
jgi:hypothetical protein